MRQTAAILIASLAVCCASCASGGWTKPGGTEQEFNADKYQCEQEAVRMYPVYMVPSVNLFSSFAYQPEATSQSHTNCRDRGGGNMSCDTNGTYSPPPAPEPPSMHDGNKSARVGAIRSCLLAHGYEWQNSSNASNAATSARVHKSDNCTAEQIRMDECQVGGN